MNQQNSVQLSLLSNEEVNVEEQRCSPLCIVEEQRYSPIDDESPTENEEPVIKDVKPSRLYWVDWLRIYASILVVYNHCTHVNVPRIFRKGNWYALYFHCALSKCCVPLFIMISGIFFLNPKKEVPIKKLYKKNILRMAKSLYFWSMIYYIIDTIMNHKSIVKYDIRFFRGKIYDMLSGVGHFWYLYFVIGLYMTTPFYRAIIANGRTIAWYCASMCFLLGQFLPTFKEFLRRIVKMDISLLDTIHNHFGQGIEVTGGLAAYYFFGYLLNTHNFENKILHRYIVYLLGIFGVVITVVLRYKSSYNVNQEEESFGKYESFNVAFYTYGVFIFFKCALSRLINILVRNKIFKYITKTFSECSFGVYLLHMTVYNLFIFFGFNSQTYNPWYFLPVYTMIIYMTTFIIVFFLRKIKFFRDLL